MFGSIKNEKFNVKGIGLGLVISKMIVNKFGGEIDFVSKFKRGTTFFYTFILEEFKDEELMSHLTEANVLKNRVKNR